MSNEPKNLTPRGDVAFGQWDCPFCPNAGPDPDTGARVHVDQGQLVMCCGNCKAMVRFGSDILRKPDIEVVKAYPALCRELYGTGEMDAAVAELLHAEAALADGEGSEGDVENARSLYLTTVENAKREIEAAAEHDAQSRKSAPARRGVSPNEVEAMVEKAVAKARAQWEAEQKKKDKKDKE